MKRNILISIIITCTTLNAFAQSDFRDGFIITMQGDTTFGKVDFRSNPANYKACRFQKENEIVEYTPNQIMGFGYINDKFFISKISEDSFVEVLVSGECNLYKYSNGFFVKKKEGKIHWLESKEVITEKDGKTYAKQDTKWKGVLSYLLSDCNPDIKSLNNAALRESVLVKMVTNYNKCKGSNLTVYKESKPRTKLDFGVTLGVTQSTLQISNASNQYLHLAKSYKSIDPSFGLILAVSSPRMNEKFALQFEPQLIKSTFSSLVIWTNTTYIDYHETRIQVSTFSIPISIRYELLKRKYSLLLSIGGNLNYNYKWKSDLITESVAYNTVNTSYDKNFDINNTQLGYGGGLELQRSFSWIKVGAGLRFHHLANINSSLNNFDGNYNRLSFSLIFYKK